MRIIAIVIVSFIAVYAVLWLAENNPKFLIPIFGIGLIIWLINKAVKSGKSTKKKKKEREVIPDISEHGFYLKTEGEGVYITNPFRGIFISGGAGSGKSKSIIEPLIEQAVEKGYTGILYDFKFPTLSGELAEAAAKKPDFSTAFYINFSDLSKSHRINPLNPEFLVNSSYAREYATAVIANLMPESVKKKDFWIRSSEALLTAVIWYLKEEHPGCCSLPHAVSLILSDDLKRLIEKLSENPESAGMTASIKGALDKEAGNQIAGVVSTLQIAISSINTPDIFWVLSGNDFNLNINDPSDPKFVCVGNDPGLTDTYSPLISLIITAALKQMNQRGKQKSIVILDEAPTVYIPKFDMIPATARSNKVATVFCAQDISQIIDSYGETKAEVILSNLANQLYGRVTNQKSAEKISKLFGKYDQMFRTVSQSQSSNRSSGGGIFGTAGSGSGVTTSQVIQERERVKPQELTGLSPGEFYGILVESNAHDFKAKMEISKAGDADEIEPFKDITSSEIKENYNRIKKEAEKILKGETFSEDDLDNEIINIED